MDTDIQFSRLLIKRKMNKKFFGFCAAACVCANVASQEQQNDVTSVQKLDEVVVSDSRFELKREQSGKTVIKITTEELERSQGKNLAEIINTKSGIEINGSRSREGAIYGVYARGGRGRQVLILIDGVRVSDPSSSSQEYDLRLLSVANIASVEIIKGAASTLYGTNAATAVINITTKQASNKKIGANFQANVGTNQTTESQHYNLSDFSNSAQVSGTLDKFSYVVGFANRYSDGLSDLVTEGNEKDPFSSYNIDVKLGYQITDKFKIDLFGNQTKLHTDYDESYGMYDAPYQFFSNQKRAGINASYKYTNGGLFLNTAYTDYESENVSAYPSVYEGNNIVLDVYNKYTFNDKLHTVVGVNYIKDQSLFLEDKDFTLTDPYLNVVYTTDFGFNFNVGGRLNNHSEYGSHFVYNVNPSYSYALNNGYLKVMGSYATSFITPSLTQLFGFYGANENLEPEENRTIEGGLEYANQTFRISALYFNRDEEQPIVYGANGYENIEGFIKAKGVEVDANVDITENVAFNANYTFTERSGDNAIRSPKHKVNASLLVNISDRAYATASYAYTGERMDTDFNTYTDVALESFSLVDASFGYELIPNTLNAFVFGGNLLNTDYTEVLGYTTKGRNIRVGLNLTF